MNPMQGKPFQAARPLVPGSEVNRTQAGQFERPSSVSGAQGTRFTPGQTNFGRNYGTVEQDPLATLLGNVLESGDDIFAGAIELEEQLETRRYNKKLDEVTPLLEQAYTPGVSHEEKLRLLSAVDGKLSEGKYRYRSNRQAQRQTQRAVFEDLFNTRKELGTLNDNRMAQFLAKPPSLESRGTWAVESLAYLDRLDQNVTNLETSGATSQEVEQARTKYNEFKRQRASHLAHPVIQEFSDAYQKEFYRYGAVDDKVKGRLKEEVNDLLDEMKDDFDEETFAQVQRVVYGQLHEIVNADDNRAALDAQRLLSGEIDDAVKELEATGVIGENEASAEEQATMLIDSVLQDNPSYNLLLNYDPGAAEEMRLALLQKVEDSIARSRAGQLQDRQRVSQHGANETAASITGTRIEDRTFSQYSELFSYLNNASNFTLDRNKAYVANPDSSSEAMEIVFSRMEQDADFTRYLVANPDVKIYHQMAELVGLEDGKIVPGSALDNFRKARGLTEDEAINFADSRLKIAETNQAIRSFELRNALRNISETSGPEMFGSGIDSDSPLGMVLPVITVNSDMIPQDTRRRMIKDGVDLGDSEAVAASLVEDHPELLQNWTWNFNPSKSEINQLVMAGIVSRIHNTVTGPEGTSFVPSLVDVNNIKLMGYAEAFGGHVANFRRLLQRDSSSGEGFQPDTIAMLTSVLDAANVVSGITSDPVMKKAMVDAFRSDKSDHIRFAGEFLNTLSILGNREALANIPAAKILSVLSKVHTEGGPSLGKMRGDLFTASLVSLFGGGSNRVEDVLTLHAGKDAEDWDPLITIAAFRFLDSPAGFGPGTSKKLDAEDISFIITQIQENARYNPSTQEILATTTLDGSTSLGNSYETILENAVVAISRQVSVRRRPSSLFSRVVGGNNDYEVISLPSVRSLGSSTAELTPNAKALRMPSHTLVKEVFVNDNAYIRNKRTISSNLRAPGVGPVEGGTVDHQDAFWGDPYITWYRNVDSTLRTLEADIPGITVALDELNTLDIEQMFRSSREKYTFTDVRRFILEEINSRVSSPIFNVEGIPNVIERDSFNIDTRFAGRGAAQGLYSGYGPTNFNAAVLFGLSNKTFGPSTSGSVSLFSSDRPIRDVPGLESRLVPGFNAILAVPRWTQ